MTFALGFEAQCFVLASLTGYLDGLFDVVGLNHLYMNFKCKPNHKEPYHWKYLEILGS